MRARFWKTSTFWCFVTSFQLAHFQMAVRSRYPRHPRHAVTQFQSNGLSDHLVSKVGEVKPLLPAPPVTEMCREVEHGRRLTSRGPGASQAYANQLLSDRFPRGFHCISLSEAWDFQTKSSSSDLFPKLKNHGAQDIKLVVIAEAICALWGYKDGLRQTIFIYPKVERQNPCALWKLLWWPALHADHTIIIKQRFCMLSMLPVPANDVGCMPRE